MSTTITVKNIPENIYLSLKNAAQAHHRSLNSEIIACLERVLLPARVSNEAHLAQARQMQQELMGKTFHPADIDAAIDQGRP